MNGPAPPPFSSSFWRAFGLAALGATPAVVLAQDTEPAEDPTVAVVDGTPIVARVSEVEIRATDAATFRDSSEQQAFDQNFPSWCNV